MNEVATGAAGGALSGAAMGAMVGGPVGAAIGGAAGLGVGLLGGIGQRKARKAQQKALRQQQEAIAREQARRAEAVQQTRVGFGDVWNADAAHLPGAAQHYAVRLGHIGQQARLAGMQQMSQSLQQAAAQATRMNEALNRRGLLGSSLAQQAKDAQALQFGSALTGGYEAAHTAQQQALLDLRNRQNMFESLARQGSDINPLMQALSNQGQLAAQRAMIVPTLFGNMSSLGLGFLMNQQLVNAVRPTVPAGAAS